MATYPYTFTGDVDLWTSPAITLTGSAPPAGVEIIGAGYHMVIRAHANAAAGASSYVSLSNGSALLTSPTTSAASITVDPSWPEWRRLIQFEGVFHPPTSGSFTSFFQGKTALSLFSVGCDAEMIPSGIADLLSLTVTALTSEGWVARYHDGTGWQPANVYEYTSGGWQKREIRYYTGTRFI